MARRIYGVLIIISIALGGYLYMVKETSSQKVLLAISIVMFMLLSMGIHGLLAHSIKPSEKGGMIVYPLLMGVLWAVMLFIYIFFIIPVYCPNFFS